MSTTRGKRGPGPGPGVLDETRPSPGGLGPDEVHVWTASVDGLALDRGRFPALLAPDETARAERFIFERDRRAFTCGRTVLRMIIGRYLGLDPGRIVFDYGPDGKPEISGSGLSFNMSKSAGHFVYALTRGIRIGADIERVRGSDEMDRIAERFFSAPEQAIFRSVPEHARTGCFFKFWTRKEAVVKGLGKGLRLPLHLVDVSGDPEHADRRVRFSGTAAGEGSWMVRDLAEFDGFETAVAIECSRVMSFTSRAFFLPFDGEAGGEDF